MQCKNAKCHLNQKGKCVKYIDKQDCTILNNEDLTKWQAKSTKKEDVRNTKS